MRNRLLALPLAALLLVAGCNGGVDADLKKPPEQVRKDAEKMSASELEARIKEIGERSKEFEGRMPTDAEAKEMGRLAELMRIYTYALAQKQMGK